MPTDLSSLPVKQGFRLRGEAISRLETLVDAAFAFALSMLVISVGTVPKNVPELFEALKRAPAFAACFVIIALFWSSHNQWSRRYGLEDGRATVLSLAFMFVMLIWVYPLKLVMSSGVAFMSNFWLPSELELHSNAELQYCFMIYAVGFAALSSILWRLNSHALKNADALRLDALERLRTREEVGSSLVAISVACVSLFLALALTLWGGERPSGWITGAPGFCYALLGVGNGFVGRRLGREERVLLASGAVVRDGRVLAADDVR